MEYYIEKKDLLIKLDSMQEATKYLVTHYKGVAQAQMKAYHKAIYDVMDLIKKAY